MTGKLIQGFVHPDAAGQGHTFDSQGRIMVALSQSSGLRFNAQDEIDIDLKAHPVIKALLARIAALESSLSP